MNIKKMNDIEYKQGIYDTMKTIRSTIDMAQSLTKDQALIIKAIYTSAGETIKKLEEEFKHANK